MSNKCEIPNVGFFNRANPAPCKRKAVALIDFKGTYKKACKQCKSAGRLIRSLKEE